MSHLTCSSCQLTAAALPSVLSSGTAFLPFIISVILLGGATGVLRSDSTIQDVLTPGLIKANIAPLMGQQYLPGDYVATIAGERVIIEREGEMLQPGSCG